MKPLEQNLKKMGYDCISPDLDLTFKEIDHASYVLGGILEDTIKMEIRRDEKIHLIGHSTGGLVIRKLISETKYTQKIGRCVLIATPNKGSKLAEMAGKTKVFTKIYKTLNSLSFEYTEKQLNHKNCGEIEMGAIAGSKNNLLLGNLINDQNDGRVELDSVYFPDLKDFLVLPFGHKEIHHQEETAKWVDAFLRKGKFK